MAYNPFNTIQVEVQNTNHHDLSFDNKLTLDMGKLYPCLVQDTLPGDTFYITPEMYMKMAPMVFPIMHRIDATIHFFYVPNRILWENFPQFLAGEDYHPQYIQGTNDEPLRVDAGSLFDYLGLPISNNIKEKIDAFPLMAYFRIVNEYYVDQNNDTGYTFQRDLLKGLIKENGRLSPTQLSAPDYHDIPIFKRAYSHDYFNSCLPYAQKGDAVNIPLELGNFMGDVVVDGAEWTPGSGGGVATGDLSANSGYIETPGPKNVLLKGYATIDGGDATIQGTINQLRSAMALQKFLELNARSGTRYNELILAHFGTNIGDGRINRPEYIGGIKNNIVISEVLQTSSTTEDSALGDYAGHGTAMVSGNTIKFSCPEHGYILGILSIVPKTGYFQGIPRKFSRMSYLDYYWKEFANIGEQAVLNKELYYDNSLSDNNDEFGYIPRYSEYKYNPSEVHGDFRTTMLDWHLCRKFETRPALTQEFVYVYNDKRIFAVTEPNVNSFYAHIYFDIQAKRKVPFITNPGGI